jgi:hypothetical protein
LGARWAKPYRRRVVEKLPPVRARVDARMIDERRGPYDPLVSVLSLPQGDPNTDDP